jgi:FtsP/CotA-like multicopper oxidase with cupredoxin domain
MSGFRIVLSMLLLPFCTYQVQASTCPTDQVVTSPPEFIWTYDEVGNYYSGTLEMGEATFDINGETLTTRAYRQEGGDYTIPGPTLVMEPGNKYVLRFKNTLPYQPKVMEHNVFKDPNITNVHTHGLHISGESPGDDVTRFFEGGYGGDYVYDIPANHMGGTFWYHAHHHGSTFLQVSSGAFGLIIIDDSNDGLPPNVSAMEEQHLVLGYLEPGNAAGTGGDSLISGSFSAGWTINGTVNGNVCLPPDTWQHWRMLVADQDARLVDLEIGDGCEVGFMARDGVWRTEAPASITGNTLTLTGASRADLAIRCTTDSSISVGGVQVANIYVDGTADSGPHPYDGDGVSTWSADRPDYLRDLRDELVTGSETIRMGARSILGRKFDPDVPNLTQVADGVQAWSLRGATNHPFHLHIYHVQVQSDCGPYEAGEFYDVVAGNCDLRFDLGPDEAFEGRTILHCHILEHEDQGAMGWLNVIGGRPAPIFPDPVMFGEKYALGGEPPTVPPIVPTGLSATATSSNTIELTWIDNSNDETSFDIERSLNGSNFSGLISVASDVTSHTDDGLNPETTYSYKVKASNLAGSSSYSNVASAITEPAGVGTALVVESVTVLTQSGPKGAKFGSAAILIKDNAGNPVDGAIVGGEFSGDITESVIDAMAREGDVEGMVTIVTSDSIKRLRNLTFCVTGVTHATLQAFTGEVCSSL